MFSYLKGRHLAFLSLSGVHTQKRMTAETWRSSIQLQDYKQNKLLRTAEGKSAGREIHGGNPGVGRQETHPEADEQPGTSGEASLHFPDSRVPQRRGGGSRRDSREGSPGERRHLFIFPADSDGGLLNLTSLLTFPQIY